MPKINIYVSDEMKARMDTAERSTNWSAVAQRAFELELNHLKTIQEVKTMTDVTERLRASKENSAQQIQYQGRQAGVRWAKHHAEYLEIKRIAGIDLDNLPDDDDQTSAYSCAELVYMEALGDDSRPDRGSPAEFFGLDPDEGITKDYVAGFVEGAGDVWDEVADAI